jgi:trimeric autotransporter adhesin
LQTLAFAGAISVNGTCELGNCAAPDTLGLTGSSSTPFNFIFTFSNTDRFQIQGTLVATGLTLIGTQATMTYLGNSSGTASGQDVLTLDILQNFQGPAAPTAYLEVVYGIFGGPLASSGSSATAQLLVSGIALPLMGPFSPPNAFSAENEASTPGLGTTFLPDARVIATFGAGSGSGAFITTSTVPITGNPAPTVVSLICSPTKLNAGAASACMVFLSQAAPAGGLSVTLGSNNSSLTVPASVTVAAGATTATFSATAAASIGSGQSAIVTATLGSSSQTAAISLGASSAAPAITSVSPSSVLAGSPSVTITISGAGFASNSVAQWNGLSLVTTFVNSTTLTAQIPAGDLINKGTGQITVVNTTGPASNSFSFIVSSGSSLQFLT